MPLPNPRTGILWERDCLVGSYIIGNRRFCQYLKFQELRRIRMLKEVQFIVAFENSIADDHIFIDVYVAFAKLKRI
jgi:hypothetical protein